MGDFERYARQVALDEIGPGGQEKIGRLRVLVVGAGGLGTPAALYLAAAGIGALGIVDPDCVELSNLQRQVLYGEEDIGSEKASVFGGRIRNFNPDVKIDAVSDQYRSENSKSLTTGYDIVVGATDNFASRRAIAETCRDLGIPYIFGGINRFEIQVMSVIPGKTSCFNCLYGDAADSDQERTGPLGAVAGIGGTLQALEALKVGIGFGEPLYNRLLVLDGLRMDVRVLPVERRADCGICGKQA